MNSVLASSYSPGDAALMLFLMLAGWVPTALAAASCYFALRAGQQRQEKGLLVIGVGLGCTALVSGLIAFVTATRGAGTLAQSPYYYLRIAALLGPVVAVVGWWQFARAKPPPPQG